MDVDADVDRVALLGARSAYEALSDEAKVVLIATIGPLCGAASTGEMMRSVAIATQLLSVTLARIQRLEEARADDRFRSMAEVNAAIRIPNIAEALACSHIRWIEETSDGIRIRILPPADAN